MVGDAPDVALGLNLSQSNIRSFLGFTGLGIQPEYIKEDYPFIPGLKGVSFISGLAMTTETRSAISTNETEGLLPARPVNLPPCVLSRMVALNEHDTDGTEDSESRDAIRSDGTGDPEARSAIRSSEHHQVSDHETLDGVLNSPTRLSDEAETTVDDEVNHGTFETLGSEVRGEANLLTPGQIHERGSTSWSQTSSGDQNFAKLPCPDKNIHQHLEPQTSVRAKVMQPEKFETRISPEKFASLQQTGDSKTMSSGDSLNAAATTNDANKATTAPARTAAQPLINFDVSGMAPAELQALAAIIQKAQLGAQPPDMMHGFELPALVPMKDATPQRSNAGDDADAPRGAGDNEPACAAPAPVLHWPRWGSRWRGRRARLPHESPTPWVNLYS